MAKIVIIGGSGHVGTYLVPRLVRLGHAVVNVSRGGSVPYQDDAAWDSVEAVTLDRSALEADGKFGKAIRALKPDIVVDMICFTRESAEELADALDGEVQHFIHVGTIWVHGHLTTVPARESDARAPFGDYGVNKSKIEDMLLDRARRNGLPATVVRPGHIVGPGWTPLNPQGHFNPDVFRSIAAGEELTLANFGLETVHHVHADDVAQMIERAITHWNGAMGEAFNAVSAGAVTLRGYAEAMYAHFGHAPKLKFQPFETWKETVTEDEAQATWEHIIRSPSHSIDKAKRLLGYVPRYSSIEAVIESVEALLAEDE